MKNENKTLWEFLNELLQDTAQQEELEKLVEVEEVYRYLMKRGYKKDFNEFKIELGEIMKKYLKLQNISEKDLESVAGGTKTGKRITSMALTALMLANSGTGAINIEMKQKPTAQAKKFISDVLNKGKNFVQSGVESGKKFIQSDKNKPFVTAVGASLAAVAGTAALVATTGGLYAAYKNFIDIFELTENGDNNNNLQKATSLLRILELAANIKFKSGSTTDLDAEYAEEFAITLANSPFRDTTDAVQGSLMSYCYDLTNSVGLVKSEQVYKLTLASIYYSDILNMEVKPKFGEKKHIIDPEDATAIEQKINSVISKNYSGDNLQKSYNEICTKVRTLLNKSIDDLRSTEKAITQSKKSLESAEKSLEKLAKVKDKSSANKNYNDKLEEILKELNKKKAVLVGLSASKEAIEKIDEAINKVKESKSKIYIVPTTDYSEETKAINDAKAAIIAAKQKLNEKATEEPPPKPIVNETEKKLKDLRSSIKVVCEHIGFIWAGNLLDLENTLGKKMCELCNSWKETDKTLFNIIYKSFNRELKELDVAGAKKAFEAINTFLQSLEEDYVFKAYATQEQIDSLPNLKTDIKNLSTLNETELDEEKLLKAKEKFDILGKTLEQVKNNIYEDTKKIKSIENYWKETEKEVVEKTISTKTLTELKDELVKLKDEFESKGSSSGPKLGINTDTTKLKEAIQKLEDAIKAAGTSDTATFENVKDVVEFMANNDIVTIHGFNYDKCEEMKDLFRMVSSHGAYEPFKKNEFLTNLALKFAKEEMQYNIKKFEEIYNNSIKAKEAEIKVKMENLKSLINKVKDKSTILENSLKTLDSKLLNKDFSSKFNLMATSIKKLEALGGKNEISLENIKEAFNNIIEFWPIIEELEVFEGGANAVGVYSKNLKSDIKDLKSNLTENDLDKAGNKLGSITTLLEEINENASFKELVSNLNDFLDKQQLSEKIEEATLKALKQALYNLKIKLKSLKALDEVTYNKLSNEDRISNLETAITSLESIIEKFDKNSDYTVTFGDVNSILKVVLEKSIVNDGGGSTNSFDKMKYLLEILVGTNSPVKSFTLVNENLTLANEALNAVKAMANSASLKYGGDYETALKNKLNVIKDEMVKVKESIEKIRNNLDDKQKENANKIAELKFRIKKFNSVIQALENAIKPENELEDDKIKNLFNAIKGEFGTDKSIANDYKFTIDAINEMENNDFSSENIIKTFDSINTDLKKLGTRYSSEIEVKGKIKTEIDSMISEINNMKTLFESNKDLFINEKTFDSRIKAFDSAIKKLNEIKIFSDAPSKIGNDMLSAFKFLKEEIGTYYRYEGDGGVENCTKVISRSLHENKFEETLKDLSNVKRKLSNVKNAFKVTFNQLKEFSEKEETINEDDIEKVRKALGGLQLRLYLRSCLLPLTEEQMKMEHTLKGLLNSTIIKNYYPGFISSSDSAKLVLDNVLAALNQGSIPEKGLNCKELYCFCVANNGNNYYKCTKEAWLNNKKLWDSMEKLINKYTKGYHEEYEAALTENIKNVKGKIKNLIDAINSSKNETLKEKYKVPLNDIKQKFDGLNGKSINNIDIRSSIMQGVFLDILNIIAFVHDKAEAVENKHNVNIGNLEYNLQQLSTGTFPERAGETFWQVSKVLDALIEQLKEGSN